MMNAAVSNYHAERGRLTMRILVVEDEVQLAEAVARGSPPGRHGGRHRH